MFWLLTFKSGVAVFWYVALFQKGVDAEMD